MQAPPPRDMRSALPTAGRAPDEVTTEEMRRSAPRSDVRAPESVPSNAAADFPRIPGYAVVRELGRGGSSVVYLADELKHQRPVAIKVLRPELAASLHADRFLREIEVSARLAHPNILPLLDSGTHDGRIYFVTPYEPGESVRGLLARQGQLAVADAVRIACEVAEALDYAHRLGVVHRDVKPDNILLADRHALVADFGIALAMSAASSTRITAEGLTLGTPAYMSPEQASGVVDLDGRSDVYSLGCVLYELIAGHPPYHGATRQQTVAMHLTGTVPPLHPVRSVPRSLERAILRALAKSPARRFATAGEFARALTAARTRDLRWFESRRVALESWWYRRLRALMR
jgi:eukaryotic-like serine/threonine-protein kinase